MDNSIFPEELRYQDCLLGVWFVCCVKKSSGNCAKFGMKMSPVFFFSLNNMWSIRILDMYFLPLSTSLASYVGLV